MNNNDKTLYVSDMDGTLLNSNSVLSDFTTSKLNELISDGVMFTVATARTPATVVDLMKGVRTNLPFILMAGCATWNNNTQEYESANILDEKYASRIIDIFSKHGNNPFVYYKHGNQIMVEHTEEFTTEEKEFIEPRIKTPLKQLRVVGKLSAQKKYGGAMLIFSMGKFKALRSIADEIDKTGISCTYNCYHDIFNEDEGFIDIYAEGTTKASAIKRLAEKTCAKRIVVFGDNLNDIPMMKVANRSIAVANAFEEVKRTADEIIGCNNDDAVVKWIEHDYLSRKK